MVFVLSNLKGEIMYLIYEAENSSFNYLIEKENNYLSGDGNKHFKAFLSGGLADELGIEYSKDVFEDFVRGKCPEKIKSNIRYRLNDDGNFIDNSENYPLLNLISLVPISVSIEFALSEYEGKKKIVDVLKYANLEIFKHIADMAMPAFFNEYDFFAPAETKLLIASFVGYENHKMMPFLRVQSILMNYAEFSLAKNTDYGHEEAIKILPIDTSIVHEHKFAISAMYETILNGCLREVGYVTEPVITNDGYETFRLSGYTEKIESRFT